MRLFFLLIIVGATLLQGGCTEPRPGTEPRTLHDDLGRRVSLPDTVRRVVSLAPSATELVFGAGGGALVVGVTDADNYPPEVSRISEIPSLPVNHEAVVALAPDLVVASTQVNDPRDAETLASLGIPTYFIGVETLPDVSRSLRALGAILGTSRQAATLADSLELQLHALDLRRDPGAERPRVLFLIGDDTLFSFGPESYVHDMIRIGGGLSLTAEFETEAPILSEEFVVDAAPEVILVTFEAGPAELLALHPSWQTVPAIVSGRVVSIDADLVLRPGPRLIEGAWAVAEAIAPGSD